MGTYITDDIKFSKISLPCPAPGCKCNIFSNIFDNYEDKIKHELLNNSEINIIPNSEVSWKWDDWNLSKDKKASFKKTDGLHFAKCIYIMKNPSSKLFDPNMIEHVKTHDINMLPKSWQIFIKKQIRKNIEAFTFKEQMY